MFRAEVAKMFARATKLKQDSVLGLLEVPPDPKLGDYAIPCFSLSKKAGRAPAQIAAEIAEKIKPSGSVERVTASGPYVNFFIAAKAWVPTLLEQEIFSADESKEKLLIEFPSPNTNKPLHLGHVRNMVLGSAVASILEHNNQQVVHVNLNNDRGIHICQSMLAYDKWGENAEPDKKTDHFVGDFYVKFAQAATHNPLLKDEAQEMLRQWEAGDKNVRALWKKMNAWAQTGFEQTYKRYGVTFDKQYYESDFYQEGKKIIEQHEKLFSVEDGAVVADLSKFSLPNKVLLRADGTSIYMTQDIALTQQKIKDFSPDKQIWVVGNEQDLHFKQLFAILELLGTPRENFHHLSYGMIELPDGKMKSREGRVVDADDLLDEMEVLAGKNVKERHPDWPEDRVMEVSKWLAMGAIRFFILKYDAAKNFVFDPENSLSFEGDTGPYLQYTHARLCSLIRKGGGIPKADLSVLSGEEVDVAKALFGLRSAFQASAKAYRPHIIAQQLLVAGRAINTYYHAHPVLSSEEELRDARLVFLDKARQILAEGLLLLGINAPEEM